MKVLTLNLISSFMGGCVDINIYSLQKNANASFTMMLEGRIFKMHATDTL